MTKFEKASEKEVTSAIVSRFAEAFKNFVDCDVIIIGGGPSGLMAGRELAKNKVRTLLIERNNYLGGGFWIGGYLMNVITVRAPAQKILDELQIPYQEHSKNLYIANGPHACSKLIASACDAGLKILNFTKFDDIVLRENNRVSGVVVNWTAVDKLPREITCADPVALESRFVIDATGHDASVAKKLEERGLLKTRGFGAMWVERSEDLVVEYTSEAHPGLVVTGMSVSTVFGLPRMGPTFGAMLMSGKKAADVVIGKLKVEAS